MISGASNRLSDRLTTISSARPVNVRAQVIGAMSEAVPHSRGMFFTSVEHDGVSCYGNLFVSAESEVVEALSAQEGRPMEGVPWYDQNRFEPESINRFIHIRSHYGPENLSQYPVVRKFFLPLEIEDQLRALLFDGPRFLGWIGLMRRGRGEHFREQEVALLEAAVSQIKATLAAAQALEDQQLDGGACAVFTPDGRLEHASAAFSSWLRPTRREALVRWVRRFDTGCEAAGTCLVCGHETRLVRLDGAAAAGSVRYLVTVSPAALLEQRPDWCLTPRQQEIAHLAACGATNAEIAAHLDISPGTVGSHMKNIYRRLEIGSRVELVQRLSE